MKRITSFSFLVVLILAGCTKTSHPEQQISVPNGDFESWNDMSLLTDWQTNSCLQCVPPYLTYIVQKATEAQHGQFAARFLYNSVYRSYATNKFRLGVHPTSLSAYVKSTISMGDTAGIRVDLYSGANVVDSGTFYQIASNSGYQRFDIPITQAATSIDSAMITINGGKQLNSEITVDNLVFLKSN